MTNEQVITRIKHNSMYKDDRETADYIIKALEQEEYYKDLAQSYERTIAKLTQAVAEQQPSEDCVDINHVIATISQHHFDKDKDNFDLLIHNLCKEVKELPPVTPTQGWIPVSERLPKVGEKVLCQCQANIFEVLKLMVDGWYHDENHCYMSGFVIAWQPLPKPYEEKRGVE